MKRSLFLAVIFSCLSLSASAQYYVSDPDPAFLKWKQIKRDSLGTVIYPDFIQDKAFIVSNITKTIRPYITNGIYDKVCKFPITLHPTDIMSNGMVTWTPSRMELITAPDNNTFAVPWLKQLTVHEFRHVAQLSNLCQGFTKGAGYVLGEQAPGLVAVIMPSYFYEGDAVAAETEMTMYGRGLQPDFTVELRAILNEDPPKLNLGKFTLGSYVDMVPDHYKLGYQVTQFAREYYGDDYWEKVLNFVGRRSYTILAYYFASLKYTGYGGNHTVHRTLKDLREYWRPFSAVENNFATVPTKQVRYAKYSWPMPYSENSVITLRESYTEPRRFVSVDMQTGSESVMRNIGYVTSRPVLQDSMLYWTEYKPSLSWSTKNSSVIRYARIKAGRNGTTRPKTVHGTKGNIYFVTPIDDNGYAVISYNYRNEPSLVICDGNFTELHRFPIRGDYTSFNGMAWDGKTGTLAAIILDEKGMYIVRFSPSDGSFEPITRPSYITVNNLRAYNGKLYYNSIQSGKDEIHVYDLEKKEEYRITTSKYGSVNPAAVNDSTVVFSSFTRQGYRLSYKKTDLDTLTAVKQSKMPVNLLNYPFKSWGLPKIDTMSFSGEVLTDGTPPKKYSKVGHLFRIHSWLPAYFNPPALLNETQTTITAGVFLMSQNVLNTLVATAGYGYVFDANHYPNLVTATFDYTGLPVNLSMAMRYGGGDRGNIVSGMVADYDRRAYFSITGGVSLPLNFSSGNRNRLLKPYINYNYNNAVYPDPERGALISNLKSGIHRLKYGLSFTDVAHKAANDLTYRSGYSIQAGSRFCPGIPYLGYTLTAAGSLYLPGFFRNSTFTLQGGYQRTWSATMYFPEKIMFPRGHKTVYVKQLIAASASYKAPLFYPDWGCLAYNLYFKRIWIDVFGEYACFSQTGDKKMAPRHHAYTYGGTIYADMNVLQFTSDVTIGISVYKPDDRKYPAVEFKFGVAF